VLTKILVKLHNSKSLEKKKLSMVLEQTGAANLTRVLLQSLCISRCDIQIKTGTGTENHNYITIQYSTV
jgi:hypothetical protein